MTFHHSWSRHKRGVVFALSVFIHDGRHLGIKAWDAHIGLGIVSLHLSQRWGRE